MVDQPDRDIDVLAEISEHKGDECEDVRSSGPTGVGAPGRFRVFRPASQLEPLMTKSRQGESRAVLRIALYRLPEQVKRPKDAVPLE
jgi:hypothetical protein